MGNRFRALVAFARKPRVRTLTILTLLVLLSMVGWAGGRRLWVEHHLRMAQEAADRRDFAEARAHLALCLQARPNSGRVRFLAARTARRAGELDLAREHLRVCRQLGYEPREVELEWAFLGARRGLFAEQEPFLWSLVEQDHPDKTLILEVLIDGYVQHFRMMRALHCLNLYLEREPENFQAWVGRGQTCERLFNWADAVTSYRRALELRPEDEPARLRLAKALLVLGPPHEAAVEFERLRRARPDDPEVLLGLARCRRQQGQLKEAGRLLDELTSRHPNAAILLERGRLALNAADPEDAERWLRKAAAQAPCDRETRFALYECLKQRGKEDEARECFAILERLDADLKRIDWLTRQMQQTPYDPALYHEAGVLCLRNGSEAEGVRWLNLALRYDPGHRPSHEALADYYEKAAKPEQAARHRQLAQQPGR